MNIIYDGQVFSYQDYGGISRYFFHLIKAFSQMEEINPELIIKYSNNKHLKELNFVSFKTFFEKKRFKGRNEIIKFLNRAYFTSIYKTKPKPQIFHPTYYNPYFLNIIGNVPFVLTIYDLAHEIFPTMFSKYDFTSKNKKLTAPKAKRIIAISENTKRDITNLLNIHPSKIDVIPLASDISIEIAKKPNISLPQNYILYVGKRNTYKNFFFLLKAMEQLVKKDSSLSLLCAGGGGFTKKEKSEIDKLELKRNIIQIDVDDTGLSYLYSKARAFVFPSLYEGFGIPILEAFACGCPAVLSDRSSFPEVGRDAALYFNPQDVSSLTFALSKVLEDKTLADNLRSSGFSRAKLFSWQTTAQKTLDTYKKAINSLE